MRYEAKRCGRASRRAHPLRVWVTGAGGFVGRHLCEFLARLGYDVYASTHRRAPSDVGKESVAYRVRPCDVSDFASVRSVLRWARPNWVIHLAAVTFNPEAARDPNRTWRTNLRGTLNLYEAVRISRLRPRILFVGTSEEYGSPPDSMLPITEECPLSPVNVYGASKAAADVVSEFYVERHNLDIVRVRPFHHTGPGQSPRFVCSDFARQVAEAMSAPTGRHVIHVGNLEARRDYSDVRDIVRAYHAALEHCEKGRVYNIASGKAVRIGDMLQELIALSGLEIEVQSDPSRLRRSDAPLIVGDSSKFRRVTGWRPTIPFGQTLKDLLDYWRARVGAETS